MIKKKDFKSIALIKNNTVGVFILVIIVVMLFVSPSFFTVKNLIDILTQISVYGVVACAMTITIICGEFDLSIGSILSLTTLVFTSFCNQFGMGAGFLFSLMVGLVCGCINGFFVGYLQINAFIVTLSTMIAIRGVALTYCDGKPVSMTNETAWTLGNSGLGMLPYIVMILISGIAFTEFILRKTRFGRNVYAVGGNYEVAINSGINAKFYKFSSFAILGTVSGFAGGLLSCRLGAGAAIYAEDLTMWVIAAAIIGGNSLSGGKGSALKTLLGMIFVGTLFSAMSFINMYVYLQDMIKGIVVVAVVFADGIETKRWIWARKNT